MRIFYIVYYETNKQYFLKGAIYMKNIFWIKVNDCYVERVVGMDAAKAAKKRWEDMVYTWKQKDIVYIEDTGILI